MYDVSMYMHNIMIFFLSIGAEVCFYQHGNYGGAQMCRGVGSTNWNEINSVGLNDQFSSVKVPAGLSVTAYEHDSYKGASRTYSQDAEWVGNSFNDVISSFVVSAPEVCFYQHFFYGGKVMCAGTGGTDYQEINAQGLNDQFSGVKVTSGLQVVAFEHDGYAGAARVYSVDVPAILDFNDIISSFIYSEPQVCFYEHFFYGGSVLCGNLGQTDIDIINARGLNDKFSSVTVPAGLQVTVYEHGHNGGYSKVFSGSVAAFWFDINDKISSFVVTRI